MAQNGETIKKLNTDIDETTTGRLASVGQIAAGIAHEVRNPLTAVKGFLQLLQSDQPHNYIDIALSELENALSTMQNLLQVSKPDLDDEEITKINLSSELEALLYLFQERVYQIDMIKEFKDTDITIYGKKNQLKKAFFNLIKNAIEAMGDHGQLTLKHALEKNNLIVTVSDTGIGIPKEKLSLIGTPFFSSKSDGTGMGLTQVFTTIYDHDGTIDVNSESGIGTSFVIKFPVIKNLNIGVKKLNLQYIENMSFKEYFTLNQESFNILLIKQASELFESIRESTIITDEYLLETTDKILNLLNDSDEYGLVTHAKEQGKHWAKLNLDLILILDMFQALRKIYWDFLYNYYENTGTDQINFFELEREINYNLDSFLKHFSSSFSEYKNEVLMSQNQLIDVLNVPIIPLAESLAILPIIGTVDTRRAKKIQEKVLSEIFNENIKHLIIDLSGVAYLDTAVLGHLFKIVNGIRIQGCKAVLTGIRPEITNTIVELGIDLHEKVETKGTLKQASSEYNSELVMQ